MRAKFYLVRLFYVLLLAVLAQEAHAADGYAIGLQRMTYVDKTRPIKATMGFAGSPDRRLDVMVWYPVKPGTMRDGRNMGSWRHNAAVENAPIAAGGPWPLVIYSHGTFGRPDNAMHLVNELVSHGYVVAAPAYPLSSSAAFTKVKFADVSDVGNQTRDVKFLIDSLLADKFLAPAIDKIRIGATGISLGAVTSYFATFGVQMRDPRITATALIGGSDPVQAALSTDLGLAGTQHSWKPVPVLFLSAEKDVFAWIMGRPYAAYSRVPDPRLEVMIKGGVHVWFGDGADRPEDGKNPDCLFFEKYSPQMVPPVCTDRAPLIDPARQKEISRIALRGFFDAFLKDDEAGLARLRGLEKQYAEVTLRVKD